MRIRIIGIPVRNQQNALDFYTNILGFVTKHDIPLGGENRWITVVSKFEQDGPELSLEPGPNHHEPTKIYQDSLMKAGIPWTQFYVDNIQEEFERLTKLGVEFSMKPTEMGTVIAAVFNDTCGNNMQLIEEK